MPAPDIIQQLVAKFTENRESYRSGKYNEARLRQEFLDPFFEALGWDIYNRAGVAPDYADVVIEDSLEIEGAAKAPDYAFKIGRERKFYVEAKKPKVDIQYDIHPAYQLRRYAWNAKLPLSILTDFEELAVYNCKNKPNPTDSAATGRDKFYRYTEYVERWDEIADIFSKDAVWKGSFDRFAASSKGKKGTTEVDDAILADIEDWRKLLALNIALRNDHVADERQLNYAVQMTIDRILFLRICEDRGIEPDEQLKTLTAEANIYPRLVELFRRADKKYNSGLFHFEKEKGDTAPADTFTPTLAIDDKVLKEIIHKVYYPCPYIFKEIPVEILGQVYEQFLGKVIHLTAGHQARIEEKPEVRKAGGVYYTPQYIVDYIVANTVGKLLEGKTPDQAASLKIVDPACGSGSFLLGAFQYLLDWHEDWYLSHDPETWAKGKSPALVASSGGSWKLTTQKKKEILVNNIHGVDIDPQAVEVTKLSLLLKVLEEESGQLSLGFERVLPDLGRNIQCGNSLIHHGQHLEQQLDLLDIQNQNINPYDWNLGFPSILAKGGFDVIIGNPPYVRPHNIPDEIKKILWQIYPTFVAKSDLYSCFMERGLSLTKNGGLFSFIVPKTWTSLESFTKIREFFIQNSKIKKLVQLPKKVFAEATVETCIFMVEKSTLEPNGTNEICVERINSDTSSSFVRKYLQLEIENAYLSNFLLFGDDESQIITEKIQKSGVPLSSFVDLVYGFKTADDEKFIHKEKRFPESEPFLRSANIHRYSNDKSDEFVWYVPEKMKRNKSTARPGEKKRFLAEKLMVARMGNQLVASYDAGGIYVKDAMLLIAKEYSVSLKFLLGVINSKLLTYYYQRFFITIDVLKNALLSLPIRAIDFSNPADVKRHDQMVALVTRMLELHKRTPATPQESEQLARDIASTDRAIDALVYDLYSLTPAEIKIVEGGS